MRSLVLSLALLAAVSVAVLAPGRASAYRPYYYSQSYYPAYGYSAPAYYTTPYASPYAVSPYASPYAVTPYASAYYAPAVVQTYPAAAFSVQSYAAPTVSYYPWSYDRSFYYAPRAYGYR